MDPRYPDPFGFAARLEREREERRLLDDLAAIAAGGPIEHTGRPGCFCKRCTTGEFTPADMPPPIASHGDFVAYPADGDTDAGFDIPDTEE
jgi:hypothetical protein